MGSLLFARGDSLGAFVCLLCFVEFIPEDIDMSPLMILHVRTITLQPYLLLSHTKLNCFQSTYSSLGLAQLLLYNDHRLWKLLVRQTIITVAAITCLLGKCALPVHFYI